MKGKKEIIIGAVVIAALAILAYGYNFLKGQQLFEERYVLYSVYPKVDGLIESNPVTLNGLSVGKVQELNMIPGNTGLIVVQFTVSKGAGLTIPANSIAEIGSSDFLGNREIKLHLGDSEELLESGDTLRSRNENDLEAVVTETLEPLKKRTNELLGSVDTLVKVFTVIFNKNARDDIQNSFTDLSETIHTFQRASKNADTLISTQKEQLAVLSANLVSISSQIRSKNAELQNIITNFSDISDTLKQAEIGKAIRSAELALNSANSLIVKLEGGDGTFGQLVNDTAFYTQFKRTVDDLQQLVQDPELKMHHTFFGKSPKDKQ